MTLICCENSEATNNYLELLNERTPQHPPDVYFIRRSPKTLKKFLKNPQRIVDL